MRVLKERNDCLGESCFSDVTAFIRSVNKETNSDLCLFVIS